MLRLSAVVLSIGLIAGLLLVHPTASPQTARTALWKRGLPTDPTYFPIAVWLQSPDKAAAYRAAGINLYVALWEGPTARQLADLKAAGMPVIVVQNARSLKFVDDPTIVGWMHDDEPDNAQPAVDPATGKKGYGPCVPPERIVADYERMRKADPTRPILLNLGQGVANDAWIGRGSGAKLDDYRTYLKGADIASFDVYPVAENLPPGGGDNLHFLSKGLDRMSEWSGGAGRIWNCVECTRIGGDTKATPAQVRAEVWLALIHGSRGIIYFVHQFKPTFNEHALLDDPEMLKTVTATNLRIRELAPVLNARTIASAVSAVAPSGPPGIDVMAKREGRSTYLFAVNAHPTASRAAITIPAGTRGGSAEVVGEKRSVAAVSGRLDDSFEPYQVHIYRLGR